MNRPDTSLKPTPRSLDGKCQTILDYELAFARCVAARLVEKPTLSVWMVLIPIVFLYWMQRHQRFKQGVAIVSEELMSTKRRALTIACDGHESAIQADPSESPAQRMIRAAQDREVALLAEHYGRLLAVEADDYAGLVHGAYGNAQAYQSHVEALARAEGAVNDAVREAAQGQREVLETTAQLERELAQLRAQEWSLLRPGAAVKF